MKKIYSKFTKDRVREFQIETYIAEENGQRYVAKRALTQEAVVHIKKMQGFYEERKNAGIWCESKLIKEDTVAFAFLQGKSLCTEMLEALSANQKEVFLDKLKTYLLVVEKSADIQKVSGEAIASNPDFVKVFGRQSFSGKVACAKNLDIDQTFDNMIHNQSDDTYQLIDYEWFFPFDVPIKYAVYRAVWALYVKHGRILEEIISLQEMYDFFHISKEEIIIYQDMNQHFDDYVFGAYGAHEVLDGYRKEVYNVKKFLGEANLFLQLYISDGTTFHGDTAITLAVSGKHIKQTIPVNLRVGDNTVFRVDPLNIACVLDDVSLSVQTTDGAEHIVSDFQHNAIITPSGQYIFTTDDPQFLIANEWGNSVKSINIAFDILDAGQYEELLINCLREQQDELNIIKNSKIYRLLLKKKIDKIIGEMK